MRSARHVVIPLMLFVTSVDLVVAVLLALGNRWNVVHDHPPAIVPGYGMRVVFYGALVIVAAYVLRFVRRLTQSHSSDVAAIALFVLLLARAIFFGPFYPWGARDVAEFVAAKGAVEVVATHGQHYYETHGRVAASLAELNLPEHVTTDPWGFSLGYVPSGDGFRVFVRGAPGYISGHDRMARELVKDVVVRRSAKTMADSTGR